MLEKINKMSRQIVVILFILMTLAGLAVTPDYGMPWDELMEIRTLGSSMREYIGLFAGEENEPPKSTTGIVLTDILENPDTDHGQSVYYPLAPVLFTDLGTGGARTLMLIFHAYTFLIFMTGVVFLYFILKFLTRNWKYGLLASLFLYLSPRFFAEGHYNSKDIITMSLIIITLWFAIKFIETKKFRYAAAFAAAGAVAANMRIVGLFFFGLMGLIYIICLSTQKQWTRQNVASGVIAVLVFAAVYMLITPAAWASPWDFIQYVFARSSNYSDWPGYVFYLGKSHRPVPWHYVPVMFAVTTPILIVLLSITGNITTIGQIIRTKAKDLFSGSLKYYFAAAVFTWIFVGYAMIKQPILYDSWRHFYFLYGLLLILAVGGLKAVMDKLKGKVKWAAAGLVGLQLCACMATIGMNHPYEFVYFNLLAGSHPAERYEMDYWNVSQANCLMKLIDKTDPQKVIYLYAADWCSADGLEKAYNILPANYKDRMKVLPISYNGIPKKADYLMISLRAVQVSEYGATPESASWIYTAGLGEFAQKYPVAYAAKAFGSEFMTIYEITK